MAVLFSGAAHAKTELLGAGASFPYPLYSKMFNHYHKQYDIKVNYQAIGSGGGQRQLKNKTVDFGGSDTYISDKKMKGFPDHVLHIPICLGAVAIAFNLPGVAELKLTPDVVADIFLGKIKKWNDPRINRINPDVKLPRKKIVVTHRSDGSGTTNIFTDYISKVSTAWKEKVGVGKSVKWPLGLGGKGNAGVAGLLKNIPCSIGYVELGYALHNDIAVAALQNRAGTFVKPTLDTTALAAQGDIPADTRVSLTDTTAKDGYPIAGFTWIIVLKDQSFSGRSISQAKATKKLINWMINDGQTLISSAAQAKKQTNRLYYAPLSDDAKAKANKVLSQLTYKGMLLK